MSLFTATARATTRSALACDLPPAFLAPSLFSPIATIQHNHHHQQQQCSAFSTSSANYSRNKRRGVSAIHRTGLNVPLHASKFGIPTPAKPEEREPREATPDHGLWGFFVVERERVPSTEYEARFGRPWTSQELRNKSFNDLHALWWVCAKERNRIATSELERKRLALGYGEHEAGKRLAAVKKTQKAIKSVLTERMYAWEEARNEWDDGYRPALDGMYE